MMKETRTINLNEELDRISREESKVQLFINENYSFIGKITMTHFDFVRGIEEGDARNRQVIIPIHKIQYVRLLK